MLIAFLGYRQVTCRETSTNSSRPLDVNFKTACFLAANIGGIQEGENKSQKLNIYVKVRTETLICKLINCFN